MAMKTEQELVTVTFFHSRSYDSWLSQRQFRSAPIKDLIVKIKNTMKAPENYACFFSGQRKSCCAGSCWTVCNDVIIRSPSSPPKRLHCYIKRASEFHPEFGGLLLFKMF